MSNIKDDPRIRLLNRLYARKRKDLQEKKTLVLADAPHSAGAGPSTQARSQRQPCSSGTPAASWSCSALLCARLGAGSARAVSESSPLVPPPRLTHGSFSSLAAAVLSQHADGRTVDELLQFIESKADGGADGGKGGGKGKKKKTKKKAAVGGKELSPEEPQEDDEPGPSNRRAQTRRRRGRIALGILLACTPLKLKREHCTCASARL